MAHIYRIIELSAIARLVTFETPESIEKFLIERSKRGELTLRYAHALMSEALGDDRPAGGSGAHAPTLLSATVVPRRHGARLGWTT